MGDFIGHFYEGTLLILLALWWMYKGFTKYIKASLGKEKYEIEMSYFSEICGRQVPLEQIAKLLIPGLAFTVELIETKFSFYDNNGQMDKPAVSHLSHISWHALFILQGIVDWLQKKGYNFIPPKMEFISASIAFLWGGMGMYFHAHVQDNPAMENTLHLLGTLPLFVSCVIHLIIAARNSSFFLDFLRTFCLLLFATWVFHLAFILYKPVLFPGTDGANSNWDFDYMANVHFVEVLLGLHMSFDLAFMFIFYAFCYWMVSRQSSQKSGNYMACPSDFKDSESMEKLLPRDAFQPM